MLERLKLLLSFLFLAGALGGYYFLPRWPEMARAGLLLGGLFLSCLCFFLSEKGREVWRFAKESAVEIRKVVWPTRRETLQTTGAVAVFVAVGSFFLWMVDTFFLWGVRHLMGS